MDEILRQNMLYKGNILNNIFRVLISENEKLYDRSDVRLYWRSVLHICSMVHHIVVCTFGLHQLTITCDIKLYNDMIRFAPGLLTGWNFTFQTIFLCLALFHDVLEWSGRADGTLGSKVRYWRDVIFGGLVFPVTTFVFSMFWSLYLIDRELVFPAILDEIVPWWFNQCVHTNIFIIILLETVLQPRRTPTDLFIETVFYGSVCIFYSFLLYAIFIFAQHWMYYIFDVLNWWQVCLFQLLIWSSTHVYYTIQYPINRLIHGSFDSKENLKIGKTLLVKGKDFIDDNEETSRNTLGGYDNSFIDREEVDSRIEDNRRDNLLTKDNRVEYSDDKLDKDV